MFVRFFMNKLQYSFPAREWEEALPLGNGRMGAMVYGTVANEHIQLNEVSVWSGEYYAENDDPEAYKYLPEIRKLINEKKFQEAQQLIDSHFVSNGGPGGAPITHYGSFQTLGDLYIRMHDDEAQFRNYQRTLDIENAICNVKYRLNNVTYRREYFISAPAGVMACRFTASKKGQISFTAEISRKFSGVYAEKGCLVMRGQTENVKGETSGGILYEARILPVSKGGKVNVYEGKISVENADEVTLLFAVRTDYVLCHEKKYKGEDPHKAVCRDLDKAAKRTYSGLKRSHTADYRSFYTTNSIHFEGDDFSGLDTDKRLVRFNEGEKDNSLCELFYQFGRYLLICSSRPENELPANLQGIWCKDYDAPWRGDYHTNINVQMNYWPAGPANLNRCNEPLKNYVNNLYNTGNKTCRSYYNTDGWTVYVTANPFGWTSPWCGGCPSQFVLGGAWMVLNLSEYYAFSQDRELLRNMWPAIKANCLFNLNILVEDENGYLVTNPSVSPENTFRDDNGNVGWVCKGTTMDEQILWENFTSVARFCDILGCDSELKDRLEKAIPRLRPMMIGKSGQLCEWEGDWDMNAPEIHHRHVSHMYGLHPGTMISPQKTPELAKAVEKTLEIRGDDGTGWSLAWKINAWARLRDGNHLYRLYRRLMRIVSDKGYNYSNGGGVYLNLFDAHPPFQIDGNLGFTSGCAEMLMQSHNIAESGEYIIDILPALPDELESGEANGLLARGNFDVSFKWKKKKPSDIRIVSNCGTPCAVLGKYSVKSGSKKITSRFDNGITYFATESGCEYVLTNAK